MASNSSVPVLLYLRTDQNYEPRPDQWQWSRVFLRIFILFLSYVRMSLWLSLLDSSYRDSSPPPVRSFPSFDNFLESAKNRKDIHNVWNDKLRMWAHYYPLRRRKVTAKGLVVVSIKMKVHNIIELYIYIYIYVNMVHKCLNEPQLRPLSPPQLSRYSEAQEFSARATSGSTQTWSQWTSSQRCRSRWAGWWALCNHSRAI